MAHNVTGPASLLPIAEMRIRLLHSDIRDPIGMSFGALNSRRLVLVELVSSSGHVGIGESWVNYPSWAWKERLETLVEGVAPVLFDSNPEHGITAIHHALKTRLGPLGRQWGARGPIMQAISAIDVALWDLWGKCVGTSIAELVGGRVRDNIPVYASGLGPENVTSDLQKSLEMGINSVKLRVGFGEAIDCANMEAIRAEGGHALNLYVDANQAWSFHEATRMSAHLRDYDVEWIEEPIADADLATLDAFQQRTGCPVALGENLYGIDAFMELALSRSLQIVQPDISKAGGFSEIWHVGGMMTAVSKSILPHLYGGAPAYAATLQWAAACPSIRAVEFDIRENALRESLLVTPPKLDSGTVALPKGHGLGIELDSDAVNAAQANLTVITHSPSGLSVHRE